MVDGGLTITSTMLAHSQAVVAVSAESAQDTVAVSLIVLNELVVYVVSV